MARKGENIYKRKDGRWEGRYIKSRSIKGKAIYGYVYAYSYLEVKHKLKFIQSNDLSGTNSVNHSIMFGELADSWMKTMECRIKESTQIKYKNSLKNYILPTYKNIDIHEISYLSLENYVSELLTHGGMKGKGLSPKTVADTIAIIRSIFRYANKNGYSVICPADDINLHQNNKKLSVLTLSEQNKLQSYLLTNIDYRNLGILICLLTGIRIGELCALKWEDISLEERELRIHQTLQRIQCDDNPNYKTKVVISSPKSSCSVRTIPLPDILVKHISENYSFCSGYVLTNQTQHYLEPRTLQYYFKKTIQKCSIRDVNYHTLRHTFATRCIEFGFDIKSLSEILGHANVNITMNRYVHPTMDLKRENMNKLSELFAVE